MIILEKKSSSCSPKQLKFLLPDVLKGEKFFLPKNMIVFGKKKSSSCSPKQLKLLLLT
jgi:hypothetical protein